MGATPASGKASRVVALHDPDAPDEPYRRWYDELLEPERRQVRARNDGFSADNSMSFKAGVEMKLHAIYRERQDAWLLLQIIKSRRYRAVENKSARRWNRLLYRRAVEMVDFFYA